MKYLPSLFVLLVTLLHVALGLVLNDGHFIYALDDPYIHLDLADQLWRTGVYGVNAGIPSSPSSSIIWPLLLGPGVGTPLHVYMPFVLALVAGLYAAWLLTPILTAILGPRPRLVLTVAILSTIALNLPALALSGMEHNWQIAATLLAVLGLIRFHESGRAPPWLWLALFLGPLIRYENALVSFAALAILFHQGQRRQALLCGGVIISSLLAFSTFLLSLGLDAMPSSIIVKRLRWGGDYWAFWLASIRVIIFSMQAWAMIIASLIGALWVVRRWNWSDRRWFGTAIVSGFLFAHLALGRYGGADFPRYEVYALTFAAFYAAWLWREPLRQINAHPKTTGLLFLAGPLLIWPGLVSNTVTIQQNMRAIYLQQFEMARLVQDFWRKPVAVNDIGLVGYRNPNYVLDLVGLSERGARIAAWSGGGAALDQYIRGQPVDLLMLYRSWFGDAVRQNWTPLGELFRPHDLTRFGDRSVLLMTPYPGKADDIRAVLRTWAKTLPRGAVYVEYDAAHPAPANAELDGP